ncbi:MAG TPA: hypothetical protein VIN09_01620 [Chloroflexota bacterium]
MQTPATLTRVDDAEIEAALGRDRLVVALWLVAIWVALGVVFFNAQGFARTDEVRVVMGVAGVVEGLFISGGLLAIYRHLRENRVRLYTEEILTRRGVFVEEVD